MILTLYNKLDNAKLEIAPAESSSHSKAIQSDNILSLSFTSYECVAFEVQDYIDFCGERFWVTARYTPKQKSTVEWEYSVKLYGIESLIKQFLVLKLVNGAYETEFPYTATAYDHVALIVDCINDGMGTTDWKVGEVVGSEYLTIDYAGTYCDEGLKSVAERCKVEYWIEGTTVNVSRCEHGEYITLGYDNSLTNLYPDTASNVKFFTRLFPIGSTRNIVYDDYGSSRLQLPNGAKYLDQNVDKFGVVHHYEKDAFAHIYPRRVGTISSVRHVEKSGEDGKPYTIYYFKDSSLDFDPNNYEIAGLVKNITFQDGSDLAGRDFEVNFNSTTKEFEMITQWPYDNDIQMPNEDLFPAVGNKYVLWNITMPLEYYPLAEQEFKEAVEAFIDESRLDVSVYKAHTDYIDIDKRDLNLTIGQHIRLENDEYFEDGYRNSRITKITRKVVRPTDMDIDISDVLSKGALEKVNDNVAEVKAYTKTATGGIPQMIRSWESTKPTDTNIFSARKAVKEFLSKTTDDTVNGLISFLKGLRSSDYSDGPLGAGFSIVRDAVTGKSRIVADEIYIRLKAHFDTLEINKEQSNSGNQSYSAAHIKCSRVEESDSYYRCYFVADDGETTIDNDFVVGDLARGKEFNIKASGSADGFADHYYWRAVVGKGSDYIDLSKELRDTSSDDAPKVGDTISQLGNVDDPTRQNAIVIESIGTSAPAFKLYKGINDFNLANKEMVEFGYNPTTGKAYLNSYGDAWIGSRRLVDDGNGGVKYVKYQGVEVDGEDVNVYANSFKVGRAKTDEPAVMEFVDLGAESLANKVKAESAQSSIDNLQVGTVNLLDGFNSWDGGAWQIIDNTHASCENNYYRALKIPVTLEQNQSYVLRLLADVDSALYDAQIWSANYPSTTYRWRLTEKLEKPFTFEYETQEVEIRIFGISYTSGAIELSYPMLVKGNKIDPSWSPSLADSAATPVNPRGLFDPLATYHGGIDYVDQITVANIDDDMTTGGLYFAKSTAGDFCGQTPSSTSEYWDRKSGIYSPVVATSLVLAEKATVENLVVREVETSNGNVKIRNNGSIEAINGEFTNMTVKGSSIVSIIDLDNAESNVFYPGEVSKVTFSSASTREVEYAVATNDQGNPLLDGTELEVYIQPTLVTRQNSVTELFFFDSFVDLRQHMGTSTVTYQKIKGIESDGCVVSGGYARFVFIRFTWYLVELNGYLALEQ